MKFAFIIMGEFKEPGESAYIAGGDASIVGVSSVAQAASVAKELQKDGVGCIELCGAFGPEKAQQLIELTHNKIAIGYVVHNPEQDQLFDAFFGH